MSTNENDARYGTEIDLGEMYSLEELPENEMNNSGNLEWVNDNTLALVTGGMIYEFKMAAECKLIAETGENGEMNVIEEMETDV